METQQQVVRNKEEDKQNEGQRNAILNPTSPPSNSSSPAHEFTFTISLHPQSKIAEKNKSHPSFAIDLTPADEIFFHGHLLPLHLLSNLPASPRFSTDYLDSFTLPIKDFQDENDRNSMTIDHGFINIDHTHPTFDQESCSGSAVPQEKETAKSRSFSWIPKWRKGCETRDGKGHQEKEQKQKTKTKIDISDAVKKYMRLIKPLLSFRNRRMSPQLHRQAYSFSGNLRVRNKNEIRGKKGELSAPASMRTSPTNSGLLVASGTTTPTTSDSTMEEVQAAIQSAIAHCKKSIATEDKIKTP
ncbi:BRI1 kinase inhibitor 1-like [Primulina huaijiensis]|uniref:BRI1 kinase inhibitor 1-like n=1 Tax=Primulina huaijiensis TaxID=1492673 RepID=UPI003CC78CA0